MLTKLANFEYVWHVGQEIAWAVAAAVIVAVLPIIAGADVDAILADPKTWLQMLGAASVRAALAGFLLAIRGILQRFVSAEG